MHWTSAALTSRDICLSDRVSLGVAECPVVRDRLGMMGSVEGSGPFARLCELLGIGGLLPVVEPDPVPRTDGPAQAEPGRPIAAQNPPAVGPLNPELSGEDGDRRRGRGAKLLGSEVHESRLVSLGHGVKRARFRVLSVPKKTGQLKDPSLLSAVGDRFLRERKDKGITHEWLAEKVGMNRQTIGRFEAGDRGMDAAALVALLIAAAEKGVDVGYVLTGSRDPAADAIRTALLDPAIRSGLRETGLQALARRPKASSEQK
jgi:transcriptional regulator with XRE-family HTH domain